MSRLISQQIIQEYLGENSDIRIYEGEQDGADKNLG